MNKICPISVLLLNKNGPKSQGGEGWKYSENIHGGSKIWKKLHYDTHKSAYRPKYKYK